MLKITGDKFPKMFEILSESMSVYLPVKRSDGKTEYKKWQEGDLWSDALNTERSAKDFFFPQSENLMKFKVEGKNIEVIDIRDENEDFVIFGAKACDVRSFEILDRVFLTEPVDSFYKNRREHAVIVTAACSKPQETCFCTSFDIDPINPDGDITLWREADAIYLEAKTDKGAALVEKLSEISEECDNTEVEAGKARTAKVFEKLPLKGLGNEKFGGGKTKEFFDSPLWAPLSEACLGCGTCTFVCPTCQCYDIKEFNTGKEVIRYRCWDSCMYSDFTKMAHGNNRNSQVERFRQRFMHKLVYFPENNEGIFGCVGCGRCLSKCPISMNIVKVMKALGGNENV